MCLNYQSQSWLRSYTWNSGWNQFYQTTQLLCMGEGLELYCWRRPLRILPTFKCFRVSFWHIVENAFLYSRVISICKIFGKDIQYRQMTDSCPMSIIMPNKVPALPFVVKMQIEWEAVILVMWSKASHSSRLQWDFRYLQCMNEPVYGKAPWKLGNPVYFKFFL